MSVQYGTQSLPHRLLRACVVCVCVRTVAVHIIQCVKGERERETYGYLHVVYVEDVNLLQILVYVKKKFKIGVLRGSAAANLPPTVIVNTDYGSYQDLLSGEFDMLNKYPRVAV